MLKSFIDGKTLAVSFEVLGHGVGLFWGLANCKPRIIKN